MTHAMISSNTGSYQPASSNVARKVHVTAREREVISHIGGGLSNGEIAREMNVAVHTVKSHVRNIMIKLGVHSRLRIAAQMYREGWYPTVSA